MQIFEQNLAWADKVARAVHRSLPPSFELGDLEQEARIKMWDCAQKYDPTSGVPFQAYAYFWVRGAVLMSVRRRHYQDATADELMDTHMDPLGDVDSRLKAEYARRAEDAKLERQRRELYEELIPTLSPPDAYLVRRHFIDDIPLPELAKSWGEDLSGFERRIDRAVRKLKKAHRAAALTEKETTCGA